MAARLLDRHDSKGVPAPVQGERRYGNQDSRRSGGGALSGPWDIQTEQTPYYVFLLNKGAGCA